MVLLPWSKVLFPGSTGSRAVALDQIVLHSVCAPLSDSFLLLASHLDSMGESFFYCCESRFYL